MQLKNVGTTDVTPVTIWTDPLICIALFLTTKANYPFSKFASHKRVNFENKANWQLQRDYKQNYVKHRMKRFCPFRCYDLI